MAYSDMNSLCQFCSDSNQNCEVRTNTASVTEREPALPEPCPHVGLR